MHNYISGIKIFQSDSAMGTALLSSVVNKLPSDREISGLTCRAAREFLLLTQKQLSSLAGVSKKTLNDFENGYIVPKSVLLRQLRVALEAEGASFFEGTGFFGVEVMLSRDTAEERAAAQSPLRKNMQQRAP